MTTDSSITPPNARGQGQADIDELRREIAELRREVQRLQKPKNYYYPGGDNDPNAIFYHPSGVPLPPPPTRPELDDYETWHPRMPPTERK
jgi:hypothetical protein